MSQLITDQILASMTLRTATSFDERVRAAVQAGFQHIGLGIDEYRQLKNIGMSSAQLLDILSSHDAHVVEADVLYGFEFGGVPGNYQSPLSFLKPSEQGDEDDFFEMADLFGLRHLQVLGAFGHTLENEDIAQFGALCDRAAEHDLLLVLEFVPGSSVPDAGVAARVVTEADRPNGGICAGTWHHFRGARDDALLREMPAEKVFLLQLSDGTLIAEESDYLQDTLHNRKVPGEGQFDLPSFFALMHELGVSAPVSVEVMSESLDEGGPMNVATRLAGCVGRYQLGSPLNA